MMLLGDVKKVRHVVALASLLALTACGGGGGGSSQDNGGGGGSSVSLSGVASKGPLKYAKVTAYPVKADGTADTSQVLGSAITTDTGSYTITGLPPSTPVVLVLTPLPAEGSRPATSMYDEATNASVDVPVSSGFSLTAALVLDSSGTTSAQVSPFTDMAAKLAQSQSSSVGGGVTIADVIQAANNSVSTALNMPILTAAPIFAVDGTPINAAAVKLAAVSQMAKDNTGGEVSTACPSLGGSPTTLEKVSCAVKALRDEVATAPTAGQPLLSTGLVDHLNSAQDTVAYQAGVTEVASVSTGITTAPVAQSAAATAIAKAKALIHSIRNTFSALTDKTSSTSLVSRGEVVADAIDATAAPFDAEGVIGTSRILETMSPGQGIVNSSSQWDASVSNGYTPIPGAVGGHCKVYTASDFNTAVEPTDGDLRAAQFVGCRVTYQLNIGAETSTAGVFNATAKQHIYRVTRVSGPATKSGDVESFTVKTVLVSQTGTWNVDDGFNKDGTSATNLVTGASVASGDWRTLAASRTSRGVDPFDPSGDFQAYSGWTMSGALAPSLAQYNWGARHSKAVSRTDVTISLSSEARTSGEASYTYVPMSGSFKLIGSDGSSVLSAFALKTGSYWQATTDMAGYVNTPTVSSFGQAHLLLEAQAASGAVVTGTLDVSDFVDSVSTERKAAVPTTMSFAGTLAESAGATPLFSGSVAVTLTPTSDDAISSGSSAYFASRRIVLNGTLITSGSATLTLSGMTFVLDANNEGSFVGTYTQSTDTSSVYIEMTVSKEITADSHLYLTSTSAGISLRLQGTAAGYPTSASILSGTTLVALVDLSKSLVNYADNTYEQF